MREEKIEVPRGGEGRGGEETAAAASEHVPAKGRRLTDGWGRAGPGRWKLSLVASALLLCASATRLGGPGMRAWCPGLLVWRTAPSP
jgi:hypothetical protein